MDPSPDTVVLVHGPGLMPPSWEHWIERYTKRGYWVIAPGWPIEQVGPQEIVDEYETIIGELDQPPIIMGHSLGGALTEILLERGFGAAGVSIDAAAMNGVPKIEMTGGVRAPLLSIAAHRAHFVVGRRGWEDVADFALAWAVENARTGAVA